jgi:hypothetical protein
MRAARAILAALLVMAGAMPAGADDKGRFTVQEENDIFAPRNRDRHYTQGVQFNYLSPEIASGGMALPMDWLASVLPLVQGGSQSTARRFNIFLGQQLFTPQDKTLRDPDPDDRPYAGWINGGVDFLEDADRQMLDRFRIQFGLIGPAALGKVTQNNTHLTIDVPRSQGWDKQLHTEPTLGLTLDRHRRFIGDLDDTISVDVIPAGRIALGNAFDDVAIGARARIGQNLRADYGLPRIEPGPSGTAYFNANALSPRSRFGWSVFIGAEGRAVGRNIFLDGNTFAASPSVPKRFLVGELEAGAAAFYADWLRLSYTYVFRSPEFVSQRGGDEFGALTLSVVLPF